MRENMSNELNIEMIKKDAKGMETIDGDSCLGGPWHDDISKNLIYMGRVPAPLMGITLSHALSLQPVKMAKQTRRC
jgi:hypothetical protein